MNIHFYSVATNCRPTSSDQMGGKDSAVFRGFSGFGMLRLPNGRFG
jgi:hypothetical protein